MKGYDRNNIKVTYIGIPKFYINERKRSIACTLFARVNVPQIRNFFNDGVSLINFHVTETAVAKCHENDTFDLERGKKIALAKAKAAIYLSAVRGVQNQVEQLDFLAHAAEEFIDKGYRCIAENEEYIDTLSIVAHPNYIKDINPLKEIEVVSHLK